MAVPGLPKIWLRLHPTISGLGAEIVKPNEVDSVETLRSDDTSAETEVSAATQVTHHKKKKKIYDEMRIKNATEDMKSGMSARSAATKWDVPRTTLQNRKKSGFKEMRRGPDTILTADEETLLCNWLIELSHHGVPVRKQFLLDSIQKILTADPRPNPFTNNRPGKGWFKAFLRRHPNVAERYAEPISQGRAQLTENCVRGWFSDAEKFFEEKNCTYVMQDPRKQYNGDETGFQLDPRNGRVLAPKNANVYAEAGGSRAADCPDNNQS